MAARAPLSLEQQAALVEGLVSHCQMRGGELAGEAHITITADEARDLDHLAIRLRRMAAHENDIKKLVTGR